MKELISIMRSMKKVLFTSILAMPLLAATASAAPSYVITDLGTLGGNSEGNGINASGQVAGESGLSGGHHAFLWNNGTMTDLGTLGGNVSQARSIDYSGQVVGWSWLSDNSTYHAVLWRNGTMADLGTLGGANSQAWDTNGCGQVVGFAELPNGWGRAFLWTSSTGMTDLGTLGGYISFAYGINCNGQVVGRSWTSPSSGHHAFLWSKSTGMTDLGTLGGSNSIAYSINSSGQAVGWSGLSGDLVYHAALWSNGTITDLGTLGGPNSMAFRINGSGQVVGWTQMNPVPPIATHAFLWTSSTGMTDLNTLLPANSGWMLGEAFGINDGGQIVGWGVINGKVHGFLMSPALAPIANAGPDQTVHQGSLVTLDGSGSSDPSGNGLHTYAWSFLCKPDGSAATLSDPTSAHPTFTADQAGNYALQLEVTNSAGIQSAATLTISTSNTAPMADPGPDQAIILVGTTVSLDGSHSYDADGDPLTYSWTITSKPPTSNATLSGANTPTPTFVADVNGTFAIQLVVSDPWVSSVPRTVAVSFTNVTPVANAGLSQSAIVGNTVTLNGSGSTDANGDQLTYRWSLASVPAGSLSAIASPTAMITTFVPDLPGSYVVQLVVNDGYLNSNPSTTEVQAITMESAAIDAAQNLQTMIGALNPAVFKNPQLQNALINKLNAVIANISAGNYQGALAQLQNDAQGKTDGCATAGAPDKNDWITECGSQNQVYPLIQQTIVLLQNLK